MNILLLTSTFPRWPDDTEPPFIASLASYLARSDAGVNVIVLAPHYRGAAVSESIGTVRVYRFRYFFARWEKLCYEGGILANLRRRRLLFFLVPCFLLFQCLAIWRVVRRERIDLIHANWLIPQGFSAQLYRSLFRSRVKLVCSGQGGDIFSLRGPLFEAVKKWIVRRSDVVTVLSHALQRDLIERYSGSQRRPIVIPHGVDTKLFYPAAVDSELSQRFAISGPCLLFTGRLVEKKGVSYLIEAIPRIVTDYPSIKLLVVGGGPDRQLLEELAAERGVSRHVVFVGKVSNTQLPKFYSLADVFIGPSVVAKNSDTEGLGVVFLEALASGTPVVASDIGGIPDVIHNGVTGLLVTQKNPTAIATAVLKILDDTELRRRLATAGRTLIEQDFSWQRIAQRYVELYQQLLVD